MQPPFRNGFTLIEIVSVLVVLGVLAYLGISAFRGNDEITAYAERDRLLSQLVYARAQGMAMGGGQCVTIDTNKVSFFMKGKSALPTLLKDYTPSASIQSTPPATFCFDAAGSVCGEDSLGNPNDTGILYLHRVSLRSNIQLRRRDHAHSLRGNGVRPVNARGFTLIEIIVTIILMAIMGFMAAQLIATTLRGSAESAGQIKDLTEATSTLEECIAYLNTEAMQQKAASDLIKDKGLEALLETQDKRELWHPDGCPSCPDNLLLTVKRGSVELSRAF